MVAHFYILTVKSIQCPLIRSIMVTVFLFYRWFTVISRKDRNSPKYEQFSSEDQSVQSTEKEMDVSATWISYIDVDGESI